MSIILVFASCVAILWTATAYNQLFDLRARTSLAWEHLTARIRARHDLVLQLLDTTKTDIVLPADAVQAVESACAASIGSIGAEAPTSGVRSVARAHTNLTQALTRFRVIVDEHRRLIDRQDVAQLRERLSDEDARIAGACHQYNDLAGWYNAMRTRPVWRWIARVMKAEAVEAWDAAVLVTDRAAPLPGRPAR